MRSVPLIVAVASSLLFLSPLHVHAQSSRHDSELSSLRNRVNQLEADVSNVRYDLRRDAGPAGTVVFLFGAFCALWAQNTQRNAWLWFFLGFVFSVITVFVLLYKNAYDSNSPAG